MEYKTVKEIAKRTKQRIDDLLALAPKNDPFYVGTPAQVQAARWFSDALESSGLASADAVHLRRVHYRLVSAASPLIMPNGTPYENNEQCWDYLCDAGKYARILGLVDENAFVDRRNPDPIINVVYPGAVDAWPDHYVTSDQSLPTMPRLPSLSVPQFSIDWPRLVATRCTARQFHLEVWAEKTTMNDELVPICRRHAVNLITGMGEMSYPAVVNFMKRVQESGMPARILYISDYDYAGNGMPISVARKVEYAQSRRPQFSDLDIRLNPIILTVDQVAQYRLPRTPVKDSDLRKGAWESHHGEGAVELDALEAIVPGEFSRIVTAAIRQYRDDELDDEAVDIFQRFQAHLDGVAGDATAHLEDEKRALTDEYGTLFSDLKALQQELAEVLKPYQVKLDDAGARLTELNERTRTLQKELARTLEDVDIDLDAYSTPSPQLPQEGATLYASGRDYFTQLSYYKSYRNSGQIRILEM